MNHISLIKQVAALPGMSIVDLKKMWTDLHKTEAPPYNRVFLVKRLAYRLQEISLGGLSEETEKRLERMAAEEEIPPQERKRPPGEKLLPGTQLIREWKGAEHRCKVLEDGFEYQGRKFGSLSAVANFITGSRWNGLVFFALKKQGDKP
ncbi:MAG: DUF2924 domain-containing protein [Magnetococcales bacterium]|nr:DUF2924 domain-containing protein [Magnetococcales bacterium]